MTIFGGRALFRLGGHPDLPTMQTTNTEECYHGAPGGVLTSVVKKQPGPPAKVPKSWLSGSDVGGCRQPGCWLKQPSFKKRNTNSLVESACTWKRRCNGAKPCTEAACSDTMCCWVRNIYHKPARRVTCEVAGGIRSANADISNDKAGEKPARRKTKGSCPTVNRGGESTLGGPKGVVDGKQVNIPVLGVTAKGDGEGRVSGGISSSISVISRQVIKQVTADSPLWC